MAKKIFPVKKRHIVKKKKRILITGVTGFIGRSLWRYLKDRNSSYEVFGVSRQGGDSDFKVMSCDLTHQSKFLILLKSLRPDYIFHFAGGRLSDEEKTFKANMLTTKSLFQAIEKMPDYHPRVIIPGTAAEYGHMSHNHVRVKESLPAFPVSWYGFTKFLQTSMALLYAKKGLNIVVARMFNIMGYGVPSNLSIGRFAKEIVLIEKGLKHAEIETRNLDGKRDFLDIDDVSEALLLLMELGQSGEIYNICSGHSYIIRDLLRRLVTYSRTKGIHVRENKDISSESHDIVGCNEKIRKTTHWQPSIKVDESLKRSLTYYRESL